MKNILFVGVAICTIMTASYASACPGGLFGGRGMCHRGGCSNGGCHRGGCSNGGCSNGSCHRGGYSNGGCNGGSCSPGYYYAVPSTPAPKAKAKSTKPRPSAKVNTERDYYLPMPSID